MPNPTTRRFRPTPAWLIYGLLVVEGLLWLSEQYRWFWFNQKKGWMVLIAVAFVGGAILFLLMWFAVALLFRWRFQFSIRSLLVLTIAAAVPSSWLEVEVRKAREQQEAVETIMKLGRFVVMAYDYQLNASGNFLRNAQVPGPSWLRKLLGDDFFRAAVHLDLENRKITDAGLPQLAGTGNTTNTGAASSRLRFYTRARLHNQGRFRARLCVPMVPDAAAHQAQPVSSPFNYPLPKRAARATIYGCGSARLSGFASVGCNGLLVLMSAGRHSTSDA
jgi:hypothetical protein